MPALNLQPSSIIDLGNVTLGQQLGTGGYGVVYSVKHPLIEQPCAIKFLDPHPFQSADSRASERFVNEAKIMLSLRHEHIVPILGVGTHTGVPFILMEHFNGLNLHQVRDKGIKTTPTIVLPFFQKVAAALAYAHSKGVVHRDIKPTNLMTAPGNARVLDFGIAAIMDPDGERFTRTGGSPVGDVFTAPELLQNHRLIDGRCDIYSLGACWYWLLTGYAPTGRNWEAALRATDGVTEEYANVVLTMLNLVEKRYASMDEVSRDIRSLISGETPSARADLDGDSVTVLGILFESTYDSSTGLRGFEIERQTLFSRFSVGLSLRILIRQELVEETRDSDYDGDYSLYAVSERGKVWVEEHKSVVHAALTELQNRLGASKQLLADDDDVPF